MSGADLLRLARVDKGYQGEQLSFSATVGSTFLLFLFLSTIYCKVVFFKNAFLCFI